MLDKVKLLTVPEYFQAYVNPNIDLTVTHNIACPFHNEESGKSFTFSPEKGIWRCWGACHAGGDVIALHQLHYHLHSRDAAKKSLYKLLGIQVNLQPEFKREEVAVNENDINKRVLYSRALRCAVTPKDWVELDYILGQVPYDEEDLKNFIYARSEEFE